MMNQEAQLETMEEDHWSHEIIFLCMGYTHKSLPPNIKVMSACLLAVYVESTVGERQLSKAEGGSCLGDGRR